MYQSLGGSRRVQIEFVLKEPMFNRPLKRAIYNIVHTLFSFYREEEEEEQGYVQKEERKKEIT